MPERAISPLELLLPAGAAQRTLVLGAGCPAALAPAGCGERAASADLVVLAPTAQECQQAGRLAQLADACAQALAPNGMAYLLAPRRWRPTLAALLRQRGLVVALRLAHLPDQASSRLLVPLTANLAGFALHRLLPVRRARRALVLLALRLPFGDRLVARALPAAGLVMRRPGAPALLGWLACERRAIGAAVIGLSGPGKATAVLHAFGAHAAAPATIAKVALDCRAAAPLLAEAALLARLGPTAGQAGARAPRARLVALAPGRPALLQSVLPGRPLALLLAEDPRRLPAALEAVGGWLGRWAYATQACRNLPENWLRRELLGPLDALGASLPGGASYRAWLVNCHDELGDQAQAFVATHGDLTMWNVLQDQRGALGVVDWEAGREAWLPLADWCYAAVDATAASASYTDRLAAFQACFSGGGVQAAQVAAMYARMIQRLRIGPAWARLCFHACWLHHAANEQRAQPAGAARPFTQIAAWLACHRGELLEAYQ